VLSTLAAQAAIAIQNAQFISALQIAYKKLDDLDRLKSDFIAIASHELRTPLGLILGYASMLKDEAGGAAAQKLDVVVQSALRLRGLIEDMVNLSHVESGQIGLRLETFCLQDLVQLVHMECDSLATAKNQSVTLNLPAEPLQIGADRAKLTVVLNNLLTNAIKFTPGGGRIMVGVEPHLTRRQGGMGLGLPIAKAIIELHGGRIWAESVQGKGSRFTFTLPVSSKTPRRG
jgi:signal transduction histidine kinase